MNLISSFQKTVLSSLHEIIIVLIAIFLVVIFLPDLALILSSVIIASFLIFLAIKYRILKPVFEAETIDQRKELIGKQAKVIESLTPYGQVFINGEAWTAKTSSEKIVRKGELVTIKDIIGLTLIVNSD